MHVTRYCVGSARPPVVAPGLVQSRFAYAACSAASFVLDWIGGIPPTDVTPFASVLAVGCGDREADADALEVGLALGLAVGLADSAVPWSAPVTAAPLLDGDEEAG